MELQLDQLDQLEPLEGEEGEEEDDEVDKEIERVLRASDVVLPSERSRSSKWPWCLI